MFEIACKVDKGYASHGNDDRAFVAGRIIREEEYFVLYEGKSVLLAVFDGVSGEKFGDEAAQIAAEALKQYLFTPMDEAHISEYVKAANKLILSRRRADNEHFGMATTVAGLYLDQSGFMSFHAGDSRIYRYLPPYIALLTEDHSLRRERQRMGLPPLPGQEHVITQYLGKSKVWETIYSGCGIKAENEIFVLCTDGIWDFVDDEEMEDIIKQESDLLAVCRKMIAYAKKNGSDDNMSVIIARRGNTWKKQKQ